jgi:hypothetical protein
LVRICTRSIDLGLALCNKLTCQPDNVSFYRRRRYLNRHLFQARQSYYPDEIVLLHADPEHRSRLLSVPDYNCRRSGVNSSKAALYPTSRLMITTARLDKCRWCNPTVALSFRLIAEQGEMRVNNFHRGRKLGLSSSREPGQFNPVRPVLQARGPWVLIIPT